MEDMKILITILRIILQLVTLILFLYQSYYAVRKYLDAPTVVVRSHVNTRDLPKPRLIVCSKTSRFNYTFAEKIGYKNHENYRSGKVEGLHDKLSWVGNTSQTLDEVTQQIYFKTHYDIIIDSPKNEALTRTQSNNFDECFEIKNYTKELTLIVNLPSVVIFLDPFSSLFHRHGTNILHGTSIDIGNNVGETNKGEVGYYLLKTSQVKRMKSKFFCKEYKQPTDYAKCVSNNLEISLKNLIGCLPPWIPENVPNIDLSQCSPTCKLSGKNKTEEVSKALKKFIIQTRFQSQADIESRDNRCAPPCTQLVLNAVRTYYGTGDWKDNWIRLLFDENADIEEDVNNYDGFSLIVEVGSSLGLWMGLSAIAIFDLVVEMFNSFVV